MDCVTLLLWFFKQIECLCSPALSLLECFFQQHLLTSGLCHIFIIAALFHFLTVMVICDQWYSLYCGVVEPNLQQFHDVPASVIEGCVKAAWSGQIFNHRSLKCVRMPICSWCFVLLGMLELLAFQLGHTSPQSCSCTFRRPCLWETMTSRDRKPPTRGSRYGVCLRGFPLSYVIPCHRLPVPSSSDIGPPSWLELRVPCSPGNPRPCSGPLTAPSQRAAPLQAWRGSLEGGRWQDAAWMAPTVGWAPAPTLQAGSPSSVKGSQNCHLGTCRGLSCR